MFSGWLHEAFGSYDEAFYIAGAVALFSSLLIFGVNYMIRKQSIAGRQLGFKNDYSLGVSEAETAPDSVRLERYRITANAGREAHLSPINFASFSAL